MNTNAATELNYIWKIKTVGQAYMAPETEQLKHGFTACDHLSFSTFTGDGKLREMWDDGQLSL